MRNAFLKKIKLAQILKEGTVDFYTFSYFDPAGLRYTLNEIYARYELPIMVVENGLGAHDQKDEDGMVHGSLIVNPPYGSP